MVFRTLFLTALVVVIGLWAVPTPASSAALGAVSALGADLRSDRVEIRLVRRHRHRHWRHARRRHYRFRRGGRYDLPLRVHGIPYGYGNPYYRPAVRPLYGPRFYFGF